MARRWTEGWIPSARWMKRIARIHTWLYRATGGWVGGRADGMEVLLLSVRGRRSGRILTRPLPFFRDGDRLLVVGSFGGAPRDPAWCLNLDRHPEALVQVHRARIPVRARRAAGAERERLWRRITQQEPRFQAYQSRTTREIPVVVLEPRSPAEAERSTSPGTEAATGAPADLDAPAQQASKSEAKPCPPPTHMVTMP